MRNFLILFLLIAFSAGSCHRKELPSTKLRKEMRASTQKSIKSQKKLLKKNKKAVGKRN